MTLRLDERPASIGTKAGLSRASRQSWLYWPVQSTLACDTCRNRRSVPKETRHLFSSNRVQGWKSQRPCPLRIRLEKQVTVLHSPPQNLRHRRHIPSRKRCRGIVARLGSNLGPLSSNGLEMTVGRFIAGKKRLATAAVAASKRCRPGPTR